MSDEMKAEQQIIKPTDVSKADAAPQFFVTMPKEYRHDASGKKMVEPQKSASFKPPVPPPPLRPVPKPVPRPTVPPKEGMPNSTKAIIITGVVLLIGLGIAAFIIVNGLQPQQIVSEEVPTGTTPVTPTRPAPEETTGPETKPEPEKPDDPSLPFPNGAVPGIDSDSDGLTDIEEKIVYSTNPLLPDSDSDGFLDGNEVFHRYNPIALAPGTLLESGLAKLYSQENSGTSTELGYSVLYPAIWTAQSSPAEPTSVVFAATTGEAFTVSRMNDKTSGQTLESWMASQGLDVEVFTTTTKNGYRALIKEDQMTAYVDGGDYVLVLNYSTGIKGTVDYLQTFQMMLNSMQVLGITKSATPELNP